MSWSNRKRVLVTGGAGFLGSHLCERLLDDDCDVVCVDNFYSGSKDNVAHLQGNPNFELLRHDVTFPLYIEVDEIYNLACPASPIHYQKDPVQTTKTNVHGAINMLGLAKRIRAKIFQASTSLSRPFWIWRSPFRLAFAPQMRVCLIGTRSNIGSRACTVTSTYGTTIDTIKSGTWFAKRTPIPVSTTVASSVTMPFFYTTRLVFT